MIMIYIDGIHMVADSLDKLHEFADRIGLGRHRFEGVRKGHPHYDLTRKTHNMALAFGAQFTSKKHILIISKLMK